MATLDGGQNCLINGITFIAIHSGQKIEGGCKKTPVNQSRGVDLVI